MSERKDPVMREMDLIEREIVVDKYTTALNKMRFVNEIKGGLGKEIKQKPRGITFIKKPWQVRFKAWLTKIFTKF